ASGSFDYAMATASADYNGHHVIVAWRPHAVGGARWVAEYFWGGRFVLARGSYERCVKAAAEYYAGGDKGASVAVELDRTAPEVFEEQRIHARLYGYEPGDLPRDVTKAAWWSATHEAVRDAVHYKRLPYGRELMYEALTYDGDDWPAKRDAILDARRGKPA
ncbi:MAG: hypothetical protein V3S78_00290, partial [Hyphomicrobium sp.]